MAYQEFAYFYDEFNGAADYDALFAYVTGELKAHGIQDGIVADFGCGTGELTLMLAQAGYDMIGIDVSEEMLSVLRDKADALGLPLTNPMLLCQDLLKLDLYGTIRAAVSTFDTYNHIGPLENFEKAIAKAAFFMEKDGVFVFDLNTPYKHEKVLSGQTFDFDEDDAACRAKFIRISAPLPPDFAIFCLRLNLMIRPIKIIKTLSLYPCVRAAIALRRLII